LEGPFYVEEWLSHRRLIEGNAESAEPGAGGHPEPAASILARRTRQRMDGAALTFSDMAQGPRSLTMGTAGHAGSTVAVLLAYRENK
jgi:hypothetical protein